MKKILLGIFITIFFAGGALAERYVMVTHTAGTDPFWPVVQKGGEDAAKAIGADFEYMFHPSGDMAEMAKLIVAAQLLSLMEWLYHCQIQMLLVLLFKTQLQQVFL